MKNTLNGLKTDARAAADFTKRIARKADPRTWFKPSDLDIQIAYIIAKLESAGFTLSYSCSRSHSLDAWADDGHHLMIVARSKEGLLEQLMRIEGKMLNGVYSDVA